MFEDSKRVRSHKSREKKTKKKLRRTKNDLQNTTHKILHYKIMIGYKTLHIYYYTTR